MALESTSTFIGSLIDWVGTSLRQRIPKRRGTRCKYICMVEIVPIDFNFGRLNLQSWLPKEFHRDINHLLVGFGQVRSIRRYRVTQLILFTDYLSTCWSTMRRLHAEHGGSLSQCTKCEDLKNTQSSTIAQGSCYRGKGNGLGKHLLDWIRLHVCLESTLCILVHVSLKFIPVAC